MLRILVTAETITQDPNKAALWLRNQPLEAFSGRTAFEVMTSDRTRVAQNARDVLGYLASVESGFVG
ncbi:DUF2384 domain-containing protein [Dyella sp. M7H15-1]|nr:DUF2384 domain-containing protein [Dyella sp. M7H15-1]